MTSLYQPITLIMEFYYMSNGLSKFLPVLGFDLKMNCAKFQRNRFRIVEESTQNMLYRFTKIIVAHDTPPPRNKNKMKKMKKKEKCQWRRI